MTRENDKKLFEEFDFFHPERRVTESLMCFGFECGDGWFQLIWDLCLAIREELKKDSGRDEVEGLPDDIAFSVLQVKEKFGGLRFYVGFASDKIFQLIEDAENKSFSICETCGKPGKPNGEGWIKTLCEECKR